MYVATVIVEQLDWDGQLKSVTFTPKSGAGFWIAHLDEYGDKRSGPFHFLDPGHEREFGRRMRQQRARQVQSFRAVGHGRCVFQQAWRGIPTVAGRRSSYALCLPRQAVPTAVRFSDPRAPDKVFRHQCVRDELIGRIVCFLDCRSRHGFFDFDLELEFRDDPEGSLRFADPGPALEDLDADVRRASGNLVTIQQFFDDAVAINASDGATVVHQSMVDGPIVGGGVSGTIGAVGNRSSAHIERQVRELEELMKCNSDQLDDELFRLRLAMLDRPADGSGVAHTDVALVDDALRALHNGDRTGGRQILGRLGREGLALARDLGINLVAAVIAAQAGIGR